MQLQIQGVMFELDDELKTYAERRLQFAFGRFAPRISRVSLSLKDVNGPRGGVDKRCWIDVELAPRGSASIQGMGDDPFRLVADSVKRAGRTVRRALERRRRTAARPRRAEYAGASFDNFAIAVQ